MPFWFFVLGASLASGVFGTTLLATLAFKTFEEFRTHDAKRHYYSCASDTVEIAPIPTLARTVKGKRS